MNPENYVAEHVKSLPRSGIRDFFAIVSEMPQAISLGIGEPDFVTPWKIREASILPLKKGKLLIPTIVAYFLCERKSQVMSLPFLVQNMTRNLKFWLRLEFLRQLILPFGRF